MVFLLSLMLYLSGPASSSSTPLLEPRNAPTDTNYRSTADIAWSCLLTIFACTWISVHPNVAGYRSTWCQTFAARLELMLWAVFAPELIVVFAFRQWNGAKTIKCKMNGLASRGSLRKTLRPWTDTHAHLLQMGGFMVREKDGCCHYLDISSLLGDREDLDSLARIQFNPGSTWTSISRVAEQETAGSVHPSHLHSFSDELDGPPKGEGRPVVPAPPPSVCSGVSPAHRESSEHLIALLRANILESDIWDRSKGDVFSKGLALVQTGWFLIQTLARFALKMDVTHLEVTTLAYAALNGVIYWFWWQKPLDVQCPIVIDIPAGGRQDSWSSCDGTQMELPSPLNPVYMGPGQWKHGHPSTTSVSSGLVFPTARGRTPVLKRVLRVWRRVWSKTFWVTKARKVIRPLKSSVNKLRAVVEYRSRDRENGVATRSTRFPMFYALPLSSNFESGPNISLASNHSATQLMGLVLASAFGAIHCIAWNFRINPGSTKSFYLGTLWRVSSLCITASPAPLIVAFLIIFLHQWPKRRPLFALDMKVVYVALWLRTVGQVIVFIYIPARLVLIVLAFYDLAWLTPSAHRTVEWTSFVPHIG
ncbi:hypothetical protein FA13DRAFT_1712620 [Coprinellus micaceus]|uniref:Uncharacterized protein n=1 Tax=Coprinellus micaceus TaxID=71717 RepID=A0A4Y7T0G9_COPMI|nr:hypothetical protein FA13DRAFT_1712620 [Coprinellus micaceus]